jgi:predicted dinucleotide-binding enzyme
MTTVGIIGAGHIGSTLARGLVDRRYDVVISNSRGSDSLAQLAGDLGPTARAGTRLEAAAAGDWVIVSVPLAAIGDIPAAELAGKIVVETNNYYWERDGRIPELDHKRTTVSQLLQDQLPESRVAKAFNHIHFDQILTDGAPAGTENRRALATASDHKDAAALVRDLYDEFGFDTVVIDSLAESWRVERDQPAYGSRQNAAELEANLARASR